MREVREGAGGVTSIVVGAEGALVEVVEQVRTLVHHVANTIYTISLECITLLIQYIPYHWSASRC